MLYNRSPCARGMSLSRASPLLGPLHNETVFPSSHPRSLHSARRTLVGSRRHCITPSMPLSPLHNARHPAHIIRAILPGADVADELGQQRGEISQLQILHLYWPFSSNTSPRANISDTQFQFSRFWFENILIQNDKRFEDHGTVAESRRELGEFLHEYSGSLETDIPLSSQHATRCAPSRPSNRHFPPAKLLYRLYKPHSMNDHHIVHRSEPF
jgi:hypothetical protein